MALDALGGRARNAGSGDDIPNDFTMDVGQTEIATGVAVGERLMVQAKQVQHGGVQVVRTGWILLRGEPELVGCAVDCASADAPAGQPYRKAVVIVVAA